MIDPKTQERLDWLAARDIVTCVCYGPAEGLGVIWTVYCMTLYSQEFARPQQAHTFDHAAEIAVLHSINLGFVEGPGP
jgi:hypothetical protein